jgi:hypothetical protein
MSTIVVPIHASLAPLVPLIDAQVPRTVAKLDAYELDPKGRFGIKYKVQRDPIVLNMQNAGLHSTTTVHYALEGCVRVGARMWPCASCGFGEPMREATIELQSRFDWGADWTLKSKTVARPVQFGNVCAVTPMNINITEWKLRPLIEQQLQDVAKTIDRNTAKLATIRPYAQQVWSSLQAPAEIAPKTWLVVEPADVALSPIRGNGVNVASALVLHARTRVVIGDKPATSSKPLPALQAPAASNEGIRIPLDLEIPYAEVGRFLTDQFAHRTYKISGGTLGVDSIAVAAGSNGKMNMEASIDYRGGALKKYRGVVYLEGIAKFDPASNSVVIDDLEYTLDRKRRNPFVRIAERVAHDAVRARLRESAKWPLAPQLAQMKSEIEKGVTRTLAQGVFLRGKVDSIQPVSVTPAANAISIRVIATGTASVDITAFR